MRRYLLNFDLFVLLALVGIFLAFITGHYRPTDAVIGFFLILVIARALDNYLDNL